MSEPMFTVGEEHETQMDVLYGGEYIFSVKFRLGENFELNQMIRKLIIRDLNDGAARDANVLQLGS